VTPDTGPDILDQATDLINNAATHPDPEKAMLRLERKASPAERPMFAGLWEALTLKLNEAGINDNDPG
jgi:hypothetical protein